MEKSLANTLLLIFVMIVGVLAFHSDIKELLGEYIFLIGAPLAVKFAFPSNTK